MHLYLNHCQIPLWIYLRNSHRDFVDIHNMSTLKYYRQAQKRRPTNRDDTSSIVCSGQLSEYNKGFLSLHNWKGFSRIWHIDYVSVSFNLGHSVSLNIMIVSDWNIVWYIGSLRQYFVAEFLQGIFVFVMQNRTPSTSCHSVNSRDYFYRDFSSSLYHVVNVYRYYISSI